MNDSVKFELATVDDLDEIACMYRKSFKELYDKYQDEQSSPYKESRDVIKVKMSFSQSKFLFIKVDNQRIGLLRLWLDTEEKVARISPILVLPEFQGRGLAQKALLTIEQEYPQIVTWKLDTIKQESKLVHLYKKLGYKMVPGKESHIKKGMDIIFFTKKVVG